MEVQYSGHIWKTRQQAAWQSVVLVLVLVPLAAWRFTTEPLGAAMGLAGLTLAPFGIAYHSWRFLEEQERLHETPTPEMNFVFRFVASTPMAMGGLLLVVLTSLP